MGAAHPVGDLRHIRLVTAITGLAWRSPTAGSAQLLGNNLDRLAGAAILGGPGALLEPTHHDDSRLPRLRDSAACSAWSRPTTTVKNDGSCSRRGDPVLACSAEEDC
jgi:hypothetical protein